MPPRKSARASASRKSLLKFKVEESSEDLPSTSSSGKPIAVGDFVRRGPDWQQHRNEDGGGVGEVTEVDSKRGYARVKWENEVCGLYRMGYKGARDLIILESGGGATANVSNEELKKTETGLAEEKTVGKSRPLKRKIEESTKAPSSAKKASRLSLTPTSPVRKERSFGSSVSSTSPINLASPTALPKLKRVLEPQPSRTIYDQETNESSSSSVSEEESPILKRIQKRLQGKRAKQSELDHSQENTPREKILGDTVAVLLRDLPDQAQDQCMIELCAVIARYRNSHSQDN